MRIGKTSLIVLAGVLIAGTAFAAYRVFEARDERAVCLLIQRRTSEVLRSYQGMNGLCVGARFEREEAMKFAFGDPGTVWPPSCPSGGIYSWVETIPDVGTPVITCSHAGHVPESTDGW